MYNMLLCVVLLHVLLCVVEQAIASVSIKTVKITYFAERGDKALSNTAEVETH